MWIYLITYLPIFLSKDATDVRNIVSEGSEEKFQVVERWIDGQERSGSTGTISRAGWKRYNPYAITRRHLTRFAVRFVKSYTSPSPKWRRRMLWAVAGFCFPGTPLESSSGQCGCSVSEHSSSACIRMVSPLLGTLVSCCRHLWSCCHSIALLVLLLVCSHILLDSAVLR